MTHVKKKIVRIEGLGVLVKGALDISITIGTYPKCFTLQQTFMVIEIALTYNTIIRRPFFHKINEVIST